MKDSGSIDQIGKDLQELHEFVEKRMNGRTRIDPIDIDLVLDKIRSLYDRVLNIRAGEQISHPVKEIPKLRTDQGSLMTLEEDIHASQSEPGEIISSEIISVEGKTRSAKKRQEDGEESSEPDLFTPAAMLQDQKNEETKIPFDHFSVMPETVADKIQKQKVGNLKQSIGINEKFYFINELFDGNLNNYSAAIDLLDQSKSLKEAQEKFEKFAAENHWKNDSEAFEQLLRFVERKFQ